MPSMPSPQALELIGSSIAAALFGLTLPTAILPGWLDSRLLVLVSILGLTGVVVAIEPLSRRFLRSQGGDAGAISRMVLVRSIVLYAVIWFMFGIAMQLVIRALGFGSLGLFDASASYAFAWLIGFVVVVIPGGLGVREGVLAAAVGPAIGGPEAAFVALTMRVLWWIATGAVGVVGSVWIGRATRQT